MIKREQKNKLIIMLIIVLMFNFIMPTYSRAGLLLNAFSELLLAIPDMLLGAIQEVFVGYGNLQNANGSYCIKFAPGTIFAGKIPAFDINFIDVTLT